MPELTADRLRELLDYDPETGVFTRRIDRGRSWKAGQICGSHSRDGRMQISIDGKTYQFARVAWLYVTGEWPKGDVDHIDVNTSNNRWANLRDVTHQVNTQNVVRPRRGNPSGYLGVTMHQGRFRANLTISGKHVYIGMFGSALEAHNAYLEVKRKHHEGCTI